jgi:hypothetical protein
MTSRPSWMVASNLMGVTNPFEERVAPGRRLQSAQPVSKHRAGRQRKMSQTRKNRRTRAVRQSIQDYLNRKAIENA